MKPYPVQERRLRSLFGGSRRVARQRGVEFQLTFEEWCHIWLSSGHFHERGRGSHQYVMARFGDRGPYAVGNVRITTAHENNKERILSPESRALVGSYHKNKVVSVETRRKMSAAASGRRRSPHSAETRDTLRRKQTGKTYSAESRAKMSASRKAYLAKLQADQNR
jgi:hypothetical protein